MMRTPIVAVMAAAMLAGCGDSSPSSLVTDNQDAAAPPSTTSSPAELVVQPDRESAPITSLGDLLGEYRVAGIDAGEVPRGEAIAVSIDGPLLSFDPTCAGFVWEIGFEGDAFVTRRSSNAADRPPGTPPPPVCAVAVSEGQRALAQALDAATLAERTPENAIRLSGGKHSVTLFSQ